MTALGHIRGVAMSIEDAIGKKCLCKRQQTGKAPNRLCLTRGENILQKIVEQHGMWYVNDKVLYEFYGFLERLKGYRNFINEFEKM